MMTDLCGNARDGCARTWPFFVPVWLLGCVIAAGAEVSLPRAAEKPVVHLPDIGTEVRAFDDPVKRPVAWWPHVVNAAWGGASERPGTWLDKNWELVDYVDRSGNANCHDYLKHRGIWWEVYGSNEYQESIHFHEEGVRKLLWDNGIAQDMNGQRVLSEDFNMKIPWWAKETGWDAFITCNNAPRWSAIIDYDWLTSPLLGFAISQDNIGGPTSRIGAGGHGRYCDYCSAKFFDHLARTARLPEFRRQYRNIREYVQANLMDVIRQLQPYAKWRGDAAEAKLLARLCEPPVMSEYQKFLYLSHLHNFIRYYRDAKLLAERRGVEYDVHGNQGGFFVGSDPYQIALADFVDTVWFESSGISAYDILKNGWNNSQGPFRYQMGRAMTRGRKPFMSMTAFHKHSPDVVEHEMAEACAGGGVLFVNQHDFEKEPALLEKMTEYYRLRHAHRAIYSDPGRDPYSEIALVYSIPTMMYRAYHFSNDAPPYNNLSGMARALEEGHLPFSVVIFNHPEIHADAVTLDELKRYRLVILPALECLSQTQIDLLTRYVQSGGTLGLLGQSGMRDEDNKPRSQSPVGAWRKAGRVIEILSGKEFLPVRAKDGNETRKLTNIAVESVRQALGGNTIVSGNLPRMLWVKTWTHEKDLASLQFVNYDIDFASGNARPTQPVDLTVTLPTGIPAEEAVWLTPDGASRPVAVSVHGGNLGAALRQPCGAGVSPASDNQRISGRRDACTTNHRERCGELVGFTIPSVRVYGVLVLGRKGLEKGRSARLEGDAVLARAETACGGRWGELAQQASVVELARKPLAVGPATAEAAESYMQAAGGLLRACQATQVNGYRESLRRMAVTADAVLALDFGATQTQAPWKAVAANTEYTKDGGFGWVAAADDSQPTPEEVCYAGARRYGGKIATEVTPGRLFTWPYQEPAPLPLQTSLGCGAPKKFRVDLRPGQYTVRVVTTNSSWTNHNFRVSGMVSVNGEACLLDAVHDLGAFVAREFPVATSDGKLEFTFGGPTGWAVAAMVITAGAKPQPDPQVSGALRLWHVSPRYANPDWYPINQVAFSPEHRLARLPDADWTPVKAPPTGLPVVDFGTNRQADIGDVVYATTTIDATAPRKALLHFGASSQAQMWLNGEPIGYVPNEKGLRRDEFIVPLQLRSGKNPLVVKLHRFWERRWMFYASLTDGESVGVGCSASTIGVDARRP